jgi:two-component system cell cycle sensor histidine kinase/response regulator CckA
MNNSEAPRKPHRILIVDDNPAIHEDMRKILCPATVRDDYLAAEAALFDNPTTHAASVQFEIDSAYQGQEGLALLKTALAAGRPYSMAFVDIRMPPGWDGVETINHIWKAYPELQVVICTAFSDYSWDEIIKQIGKTDSLVILKKPFDNIEVLQLAHTLTEKWTLNREVKGRLKNLDQLVSQRTNELMASNEELRSANERLKKEIADRMQMENAWRLSEERFAKAFHASPIPMAILSLTHETFMDANHGFVELTGFQLDELAGQKAEEFGLWEDFSDHATLLQKLHTEKSIRKLSRKLKNRGGQSRDTLFSAELFELGGEPFILTIVQDITEQIKLESQLRQSQKMEAVGQLAAGIAHDFNNILTVVQGLASVILSNRPPEATDRKPLETIVAAADRAAKLVRQLLTFSRRQIFHPQPIDFSDNLILLSEMLPRMLGENISLKVVTPPNLPMINGDAVMMEQLMMNLALNARDAMADGGQLTITAGEVEVTAESPRDNPDAYPGRFVCLSVTDTGCGMAAEVLAHVFEPFYTTKPIGKGTGLGLATVYGIAQQHHGWVEVLSELSKGSTFKVFIPALTKSLRPIAMVQPLLPTRGGSETILLVEDEEPVRRFVTDVLRSHGYSVLTAESGPSALEEWAKRDKHIDLLLTDMVMPGGLSGRDLARKLLSEAPGLKVIYTSGYSPGLARNDISLLEEATFLAKPYVPSKLLQLVRCSIDRLAPAEPKNQAN